MSTIIVDAIGLLGAGKDALALLSRQHPSATQDNIAKALRDAAAAYDSACRIAETCYAENLRMEVAVSRLHSAYPTLTLEQAQHVMRKALKDMR